MAAVIRLLPDLAGMNVKVVCATSPSCCDAPESYRMEVLSEEERLDSTVITTQARWLMHDWLYTRIGEEYAMSADWDDRWRTGGTLEEILEEAHLTPEHILSGVRRFVGGEAAAAGPPVFRAPLSLHARCRSRRGPVMKRTALYDRHVALGARMVDFAGWEMPSNIPRGSVRRHLQTRRRAGLFDVSHMGRFFVFRGTGASAFSSEGLDPTMPPPWNLAGRSTP